MRGKQFKFFNVLTATDAFALNDYVEDLKPNYTACILVRLPALVEVKSKQARRLRRRLM